MNFHRPWTIFALDAEHDAYGMARIAQAHNTCMSELASARAERDIACTALCPHGLDIAAKYENAKRELAAARAECEQYRHERDAYRDAMARMNAPAIAMAALQPPPPIIMPAQDWELHQQIQTLNERIAYLEPIFIAARNLVDNAEEYECDGLGLWAQHGWWEPLHDALDPDGSDTIDDLRHRVESTKRSGDI